MANVGAAIDQSGEFLREFETRKLRDNGRLFLVPLVTMAVISVAGGKAQGHFMEAEGAPYVIALFLAIEAVILLAFAATSRRSARSAERAFRLFDGKETTEFDKKDWVAFIQLYMLWNGEKYKAENLSPEEWMAVHFAYGYRVKVTMQALFCLLAEFLARVIYNAFGLPGGWINALLIVGIYIAVYPTQDRMIRWVEAHVAEFTHTASFPPHLRPGSPGTIEVG